MMMTLSGDDLSTSMAAWLKALHQAAEKDRGRADADWLVDLVLQETRRKIDLLTKPKRPDLRLVKAEG